MTAETFTPIPARVADTAVNRKAAAISRLNVHFYRPGPGLIPGTCYNCHRAVLVETTLLELGRQLTQNGDIRVWCDMCVRRNPPKPAWGIVVLRGKLADTPSNRAFVAERRLDRMVTFAGQEQGWVEVQCEAHGGLIYVPEAGLKRRGHVAAKGNETRVLCLVCAATLDVLAGRLRWAVK